MENTQEYKLIGEAMSEIVKLAGQKNAKALEKPKRTFWSPWFSNDEEELKKAAKHLGYMEGLLAAQQILADKITPKQ